jgi:hypothetical protein
MFRQLLRAIMPGLSLQATLDRWAQISVDLAEPLRKRPSQVEILTDAEEEFL